MATVNVHAAKTHLSRLLRRASAGEEIVIARDGRPVARLVPVSGAGRARKLGGFESEVRIPADFDAPLPRDLQALFDGGGDADPA